MDDIKELETILIFKQGIDVAEIQSEYERTIFAHGGNIENLENWGVRKLAYPIKDNEQGLYMIILYNMDGDYLEKSKSLDDFFSKDTRVLKHLTVYRN